ncbi:hypothetical protein A7U60_g4148 [Sanghuangporus baumii]|uniref:Aminoglycoside phosphotransferase domain-containing protein n=1 Tax=Sanghuangporus baumii TaxID=108892 RepID=A0A9Q5HZ39_SANBA|nr:hypothetical protein A7U60_g4148 [Sanghuangporus baumii]
MRSLTESVEDLLYRLIAPILLCKFRAPRQQVILSTSALTDEEIRELYSSSPKVDEGTWIIAELGSPNRGRVAKIASDVVVKYSFTSGFHELLSAELVRRHTSVPVPMYERVFRYRHEAYVVQQYIPGRVLLDVWSQLSWWMRLRVLVTLRFYIRELRSISSRAGPPPFPGPPSDDGTPQKCTGRLFTEDGQSGPFHSYQEMSKWYQKQLLFMQRQWKVGLDSGPFDDSVPLVFTHMDLHPRNLILGDDGQLWIVDWNDAGWYPSWFEAASMKLFPEHRPDIPSSWTSSIPFIAGSCEKPGQLPFMKVIPYTLVVLGADWINRMETE